MKTNILIINPNSTTSMTDDIAVAARAVALPQTKITAVNPKNGPASIQGAEDGEAALPHLLDQFDNIMAGREEFDAVIIACFDDTGLNQLKARSSVPVLGIGESAFHTAALLGASFSTITTLSVSIPIIETNIARYGFGHHSKKVRASEVPVLAVGSETDAIIRAEAATAITEDGCESIVLGCAGMANLAKSMSADFRVPVIDGVAAAVTLGEALARLRAKTFGSTRIPHFSDAAANSHTSL